MNKYDNLLTEIIAKSEYNTKYGITTIRIHHGYFTQLKNALRKLSAEEENEVISEPMLRLAKEYISKVECCDGCFCESWCIENGAKESRLPYKGCEWNIIKHLAELFRE